MPSAATPSSWSVWNRLFSPNTTTVIVQGPHALLTKSSSISPLLPFRLLSSSLLPLTSPSLPHRCRFPASTLLASSVFRQSYHSSLSPSPTTQRQFCPHGMPDWKHSQYFFRQPVLRQLHPFRLIRLLFPSPTTRGLNALLFRVSSTCFASSRSFWCSCASPPTPAPTRLFMQFTQLQPLQNWSDAKHSQYSFRHRDFLQLHDRCYASPRRVTATVGTA